VVPNTGCTTCAVSYITSVELRCVCEDQTSPRLGSNLDSQEVAGFEVFPNPSNGQFLIQLKNKEEGEMKLSLFSLSGASVFEYESFLPEGMYQKSIDLSEQLGKGIYYMELRVGNQTFNKKIITQ